MNLVVEDQAITTLQLVGMQSDCTAGTVTNVRASFERLRIDPLTLEVDIDDRTFSSSGGMLMHGQNVVTEISYAVAMSCDGNSSGAANINLVDTPFYVDDTFCQGGFQALGQTMVSDNGQTVTISGGGSCGWTSPTPCGGGVETGITNLTLQLNYM